ncbi:MAG: hypothetical protein HRT54_23760 [Colwellia sp.]|nr:hypothetical protein [Colwellia sp.]
MVKIESINEIDWRKSDNKITIPLSQRRQSIGLGRFDDINIADAIKLARTNLSLSIN